MQVVHLSDAYGGRCGRIGERYENSYVFLAKLQRKIAVCYLIRSIKPLLLEEKVGFEPTVPCGTPDFESGTFGHSATSPYTLVSVSRQFYKNASKHLCKSLQAFSRAIFTNYCLNSIACKFKISYALSFESGTFGHSATSPHFVAQIVPAPCNPDCKGFSLITAGVGLAFLRSHTSPRRSKSIINCPKASYFIG